MNVAKQSIRIQWVAMGIGGSLRSNADVEKHVANSKNWATQAGDFYNQRYSKLKQINTGNVGKMQVA